MIIFDLPDAQPDWEDATLRMEAERDALDVELEEDGLFDEPWHLRTVRSAPPCDDLLSATTSTWAVPQEILAQLGC
jgi:hypothetical protein